MGITSNVATFDQWIRSSFVEMNTELEGVYWDQDNKADVTAGGDDIKQQMLHGDNRRLPCVIDQNLKQR